MSYAILMQRQAKNKLQSLPRNDRVRIAEKISQLGRNPDDPTLDTKSLAGVPLYRLRVGDWRIICDIQDQRIVVRVLRIGNRREIYR